MSLPNFDSLEEILETNLLNALKSYIPKDVQNLYQDIDVNLQRKYLSLYEKGIELMLDLDSNINHIRFYLNTKGYAKNYSYYAEELPFGMHNLMKKEAIHEVLGIPSQSFERFENKFTTFPEIDKYLKDSYYIEIGYNTDLSLYSVGICIEKDSS
jgi:hypothetical protein